MRSKTKKTTERKNERTSYSFKKYKKEKKNVKMQ